MVKANSGLGAAWNEFHVGDMIEVDLAVKSGYIACVGF
jgi:hypothetical protein